MTATVIRPTRLQTVARADDPTGSMAYLRRLPDGTRSRPPEVRPDTDLEVHVDLKTVGFRWVILTQRKR